MRRQNPLNPETPVDSVKINDRNLAYSFFEFFYDAVVLNENYSNSKYSVKNLGDLNNCYFTPDIIRLKSGQKLYVLGDLHADFDYMTLCLLTANLIDQNGNWTGKDSVIVQLGDILDSRRELLDGSMESPPIYANKESQILNFLKNLHLQAITKGGMVITMIGNHDLARLFLKMNHNDKPFLVNQDDPDREMFFEGAFESYSVSNHYMTDENMNDFDSGNSLRNLPRDQINQYSDRGFYRQLYASCASKTFVKFVWGETGIGGLISHGEKRFKRFIEPFFNDLQLLFKIIRDEYDLNLPYLDELLENTDYLIILLNCIISFTLRYYHNIVNDPNEIFTQTILTIVDNLAGNSGILFARLNEVTCRDNGQTQEFFQLNPLKSINLSAHSGSEVNGIVYKGCYDLETLDDSTKRWLNYQDISNHNNQYGAHIMVDVLGSRAFGVNEFTNMPRGPQIVQISLRPYPDVGLDDVLYNIASPDAATLREKHNAIFQSANNNVSDYRTRFPINRPLNLKARPINFVNNSQNIKQKSYRFE